MRTRVTAHHTAYKTKDHLKDLLKGIGVKGARLLQEEAVDGQPAATGLKGGPHQAARAVDVERTAGGHRLGHQQAQAGRVRLRAVGAVPRILQRFHCHHRHAAVSGLVFHIQMTHTPQQTYIHTKSCMLLEDLRHFNLHGSLSETYGNYNRKIWNFYFCTCKTSQFLVFIQIWIQ